MGSSNYQSLGQPGSKREPGSKVNSFPQDFGAGDLFDDQQGLKVVVAQAPYIALSRAVSRRQAASLSKTWVEANPSVWSQHVFDQWNVFWQRDVDSSLPPGSEEFLNLIPQVQAAPLVPLDFSLWSRVLKTSKPHSMRGVDGWSFAELKLIPQGFVDVLLQLFHWCEQTCMWPKVFQTWLVVLLRKVPTGIVSWSSVRPISVAATLYRMWSKMRAAQLMEHARTLATSTVRPCLSTRSIWGFQVELIAEFLSNSISPCGLVLDLIKAFNVVCRPFLEALMLRLGFQPTIVLAWFSCLRGLSRQALVAGAVFGTSHSTTGIPEGDPLSVVGMYALCCLFKVVVMAQDATTFTFTYADNWEVIAGACGSLMKILGEIDRMSSICRLPIAPSKCWTWSFQRHVRRQLASCTLDGKTVPVRLTGCCLGADMAYSFKKAASTRNGRVASGHRRLLRLQGLPISKYRKCRLILGGVFPHALHACEASWLPPSLLARLRSKVVKALKLNGSGVNPHLACSVASPALVDPEWSALASRVRLFRLLWTDYPDFRDMLVARLTASGGKYRTPIDHLVRVLRGLGWECTEGTSFQDGHGRRFSLVSSSLSHVLGLLSWNWGVVLRDAVKHRKGLEHVDVIHVAASRPSKGLLPSERGLLSQLVSGRHFTRDAQSQFAGSTCDDQCPHCNAVKDSREHRVFECVAFQPIRDHYAAIFGKASRASLLYGLWPYPDGYVAWQASLDALQWPAPVRKLRSSKQCFFTDGSCLFPAVPDIRIAGAAVITPCGPGTIDTVWADLLPTSHQTIQRAEVLAGAVAVGSALHPVVISDSLYFVRIARRVADAYFAGTSIHWPTDNLDVWEFFVLQLEGCDSAEFVWVKAHQNLAGLEGLQHTLACGNDHVDKVAKKVVHDYKASSGLYQKVVRSKLEAIKIRHQVDSFHLYLAFASLGLELDAPTNYVAPVALVTQGSPWVAIPPVLSRFGFHESFVRQVFNWFCSLQWFEGCSPGPVSEISWVELFLWWTVDSGTLPPFRVDGRWVRIGDDEEAICCVPSAYTLFGTWRRAVSFVLRLGTLIPGVPVSAVSVAAGLGASFALSGVTWRPRVSLGVRQDLALQFTAIRSLHSLRLPPVW